jgi:hypothetical protein
MATRIVFSRCVAEAAPKAFPLGETVLDRAPDAYVPRSQGGDKGQRRARLQAPASGIDTQLGAMAERTAGAGPEHVRQKADAAFARLGWSKYDEGGRAARRRYHGQTTTEDKPC